MRQIVALLIVVFFAGTNYADDSEALDQAENSIRLWVSLTDNGQYSESWEEASSLFKARVSESDWVKSIESVRTPLGSVQSRNVASATYTQTLPGVPDGEYVVIQFNSSFANKASAVETLTATKEGDGTWRAAGYFIK